MPEKFKSKTEMIDAVVSGKVVENDNGCKIYRDDDDIDFGPFVLNYSNNSFDPVDGIWSAYEEYHIKPEPKQVQITDRIELMKEIKRLDYEYRGTGGIFVKRINDLWKIPGFYAFQQDNDIMLFRWIPANEAPDGETRKFMKKVEK